MMLARGKKPLLVETRQEIDLGHQLQLGQATNLTSVAQPHLLSSQI